MRRQSLLVGSTIVAGLLLVTAAASRLHRSDTQLIAAELRAETDRRAGLLDRQIAANLEVLHTLSLLFEGHLVVSPTQFASVAQRLGKRCSSVQALEWVPAVPHAERPGKERECADWLPGFEFTERRASGEIVRAGDRPVYYPVCLIEPREGNEEAIGFDLGSDPIRLGAIESARDTGLLTVTAGITLVQEREGEKGFLGLLPVYRGTPSTLEERREALRGFVAGAFRVGDIFRGAVRSEDAEDVHLTLVDVTNPDARETLHSHAAASPPLGEEWTRRRALSEVVGRRWGLIVTASRDYVAARRTWAPPVFVGTGVVLTLLGLLLFLIARRQQRAALDLERRERELTHTMRLSILGELVAGVTHEVSQPLTAIANYAGASVASLKSGRVDEAKLFQWSSDIAKQAKSCGDIITRIRKFARKAEGEHERFQIDPVIRESAALVGMVTAPPNVATSFDFAKPSVSVRADRVQIQQVLVNLLRNAFEASSHNPGGRAAVAVRTIVRDGMLEVQVSDNGPGIQEKDVERVFDAFYTTKGEGLGLGLAICRSILEDHRGRLWATPNAESGVTFHFSLPIER